MPTDSSNMEELTEAINISKKKLSELITRDLLKLHYAALTKCSYYNLIMSAKKRNFQVTANTADDIAKLASFFE